MDHALLPIRIPAIDTQEYANAIAKMMELENKLRQSQNGGSSPSSRPRRHPAIPTDGDINAHQKALEAIAAHTKIAHDLEVQMEGQKTKKIVAHLTDLQAQKKVLNATMRSDAAARNDKETQDLKKSLDEQIGIVSAYVRKREEVNRGGAGSIAGILGTGRNLIPSGGIGGAIGGILGGGGLAYGMKEAVSAGIELTKVEDQIKTGFLNNNVAVKDINAALAESNKFTQIWGDKLAVPELRMKELVRDASLLGGFTGAANEQMVKMAAAVEKQTGGEVTGEQFIKGIAKGFADPESDNLIGRLKLKFAAYASAVKDATDQNDLFQKTIKFTNTLVQQQGEFAETTAGRMERAANRGKNALEKTGQWILGAVDSIGMGLTRVFGSNDTSIQIRLLTEDLRELEAYQKTGGHRESDIAELKEKLAKLAETSPEAKAQIDLLTQSLNRNAGAADSAKTAAQGLVVELQKEVDDLQTGYFEKRAAVVKGEKDLANAKTEGERYNAQLRLTVLKSSAKDAEDQIKKNDALFRQADLWSGATEPEKGKKGKTAEQRAQEAFEKRKAFNAVIAQQETNNAYQLFFTRQLTEEGWKKAKEKNEEVERAMNMLAVRQYYKDLGYIEGTEALNQAVANDKDFQALLNQENAALDLHWQERLTIEKKGNATRLQRQTETKAWQAQVYDEDTNLLKLQLQLINDKKTKSLAVIFDEFAMRREIEEREYKSTLKNYATLEEAWKAHLLRLQIIGKEEAAAKASVETQANEMTDLMKSAAQKSASAFENEFWKPMDARAKNWGDKLILDIAKMFATKGLNKVIDEIFDPKKKDDQTVSKYDHALIHAENVILQVGSLANTAGGGNAPGVLGNPGDILRSDPSLYKGSTDFTGMRGGLHVNGAHPWIEVPDSTTATQQQQWEQKQKREAEAMAKIMAEHKPDEAEIRATQGTSLMHKLGNALPDNLQEKIAQFNELKESTLGKMGEAGHLAHLAFTGHGVGLGDIGSGSMPKLDLGAYQEKPSANPEQSHTAKATEAGVTNALAKLGGKAAGGGKIGAKDVIGAGLNFIPGVGPILSSIFSALPIPGLADGGKRPSGPHITGEHGPELDDGKGNVYPLGRRTHYADSRRYEADRPSYGGISTSDMNAMHGALMRSNAIAEKQTGLLEHIAANSGYKPYEASVSNAQNLNTRMYGRF